VVTVITIVKPLVWSRIVAVPAEPTAPAVKTVPVESTSAPIAISSAMLVVVKAPDVTLFAIVKTLSVCVSSAAV
jgi:hypothetical protein